MVFIETYHSSTIIKSKVSLDEMIKNPKKKAILWGRYAGVISQSGKKIKSDDKQ